MDLNDKVERTGAIGDEGGASKARVPVDLVDILLEALRKEARAADRARSEESNKLRADAIYRSVLEKLREDEERRQRSWGAALMRFLNRVAAPAATLWNSRAIRSLVP